MHSHSCSLYAGLDEAAVATLRTEAWSIAQLSPDERPAAIARATSGERLINLLLGRGFASGVRKRGAKYRADIWISSSRACLYLGTFITLDDALAAYEKASSTPEAELLEVKAARAEAKAARKGARAEAKAAKCRRCDDGEKRRSTRNRTPSARAMEAAEDSEDE